MDDNGIDENALEDMCNAYLVSMQTCPQDMRAELVYAVLQALIELDPKDGSWISFIEEAASEVALSARGYFGSMELH